MAMIALYGIANCDGCRKARRWLTAAGIDHTWVDLRERGLDVERLRAWRDALGANTLVNKRSKTWRDFDANARERAKTDPLAVLAEHPTLVKRPILETPTRILAGFSGPRYEAALAGVD